MTTCGSSSVLTPPRATAAVRAIACNIVQNVAAWWRGGRAGEAGLHTLQPTHRRCDCTPAAHRPEGLRAGPMAASRYLGHARQLRTRYPATRCGARLHRHRRLLLDQRLGFSTLPCAKSSSGGTDEMSDSEVALPSRPG